MIFRDPLKLIRRVRKFAAEKMRPVLIFDDPKNGFFGYCSEDMKTLWQIRDKDLFDAYRFSDRSNRDLIRMLGSGTKSPLRGHLINCVLMPS